MNGENEAVEEVWSIQLIESHLVRDQLTEREKKEKKWDASLLAFVCTPFDLSLLIIWKSPFQTKGNKYSIYCFHVCHSFFFFQLNSISFFFSFSIPNSISRSLFFFSLARSLLFLLFIITREKKYNLSFFCIHCLSLSFCHSLTSTNMF